MNTYIIQCRLGMNEFFLTIDADTIGEAILSGGQYLNELEPTAVFEIYAVQQTELEIVLEDVILN